MMNNSHQNPERSSASSSSELPWLAFCYVANELDAETRREFEIRLEHDQTAREAVAQAFDNAWMLDQALSAQDSPQAATCELPQLKIERAGRSNAITSNRLLPAVLLGLCVAMVLAMVPQIYNAPAAKVAVIRTSPTQSELTNTSVALAETWADFDWETESAGEIADLDPIVTQPDHSDCQEELVVDDRDDWMTTTLIDMAEEPDSQLLQSGS